MVFFRNLFCTIVCVGTAQTALAMNIISDPTTGTGKAPYADGWRGGATMYPKDSTYRTPKEIVNLVCTAPNLRNIQKYIKDGKLAVNDPLICCVGDRDPRSFYYPVEWIIYRWDKPEDAKMLEFLLKNGVPVDGYQDFNLLRGVLESLADLVFACEDSSYTREKKKSRSNFLLKCLTILLDFGVDIHKPFPEHNGFGFDNSPFVGHTAKDFLDQTQNPWSNADLWKQVKEKFDIYEHSKLHVQTVSKIIRAQPAQASIQGEWLPQPQKKINVKSELVVMKHLLPHSVPQPTGQPGPQLEQKISLTSTCTVAGLGALLAVAYTAYQYWWQQTDDEDAQESVHDNVSPVS